MGGINIKRLSLSLTEEISSNCSILRRAIRVAEIRKKIKKSLIQINQIMSMRLFPASSSIVVVLLLLIFLVNGCQKKISLNEKDGSDPRDFQQIEIKKDTYQNSNPTERLDSSSLEYEPPSILEGRTSAPMVPIYFDFDSANIMKDQREILHNNGAYLKNLPNIIIRIEGNCDERGTNEYNMALSERRALRVKNFFINLGIDSKRLTSISYGEEKPLLYGHDELSWAQNRRVDFVVIQ